MAGHDAQAFVFAAQGTPVPLPPMSNQAQRCHDPHNQPGTAPALQKDQERAPLEGEYLYDYADLLSGTWQASFQSTSSGRTGLHDKSVGVSCVLVETAA